MSASYFEAGVFAVIPVTSSCSPIPRLNFPFKGEPVRTPAGICAHDSNWSRTQRQQGEFAMAQR